MPISSGGEVDQPDEVTRTSEYVLYIEIAVIGVTYG
jgi:hypothetical protein